MITASEIADRLGARKTKPKGWIACCPVHEDTNPSLSISEGEDGKTLLYCHAGCSFEEIVAALQIDVKDLMGRDEVLPRPQYYNSATPQTGCKLAEYADAKKIPIDVLRSFGLVEYSYLNKPAIRIPYLDEKGTTISVRFRTALIGTDRFRWRKGDKPILYGLSRLADARAAGHIVFCEGESDCHTLWHHGIPAVGLPGAGTWREEWCRYFEGVPIIYAVIEPDTGGDTVLRSLMKSGIRNRVRLVQLDEHKDASCIYLATGDGFRAAFEAALQKSQPLCDYERELSNAKMSQAWNRCADLARKDDILGQLIMDLARCHVCGEQRVAKLIFLTVMTRFLKRPVALAVKGPSSGGKSYLTEKVLSFFPENAYFALSAMSERALAYSEEPLEHRMLVIYEAAGLRGDFSTYLMRSLLSEGCIRYETVEKTKDGIRPRLIERSGPTGLIVTTTAVSLHPENETRMLSVTVTDTREHTHQVLLALAEDIESEVDLSRWHALQNWLESAEHSVTIPYATILADIIPPVAVRLRRDFTSILNLIRAHAMLHQVNRERDGQGCIIATLADYAAVRELTADLIAEGVDATVPQSVRETVEAVKEIANSNYYGFPVTLEALADKLRLDKSTVSRRVNVATERGYLRNLEDKHGKPSRLVVGQPLPAHIVLLPSMDTLAERCSVAALREGNKTIPSPDVHTEVAGGADGQEELVA